MNLVKSGRVNANQPSPLSNSALKTRKKQKKINNSTPPTQKNQQIQLTQLQLTFYKGRPIETFFSKQIEPNQRNSKPKHKPKSHSLNLDTYDKQNFGQAGKSKFNTIKKRQKSLPLSSNLPSHIADTINNISFVQQSLFFHEETDPKESFSISVPTQECEELNQIRQDAYLVNLKNQSNQNHSNQAHLNTHSLIDSILNRTQSKKTLPKTKLIQQQVLFVDKLISKINQPSINSSHKLSLLLLLLQGSQSCQNKNVVAPLINGIDLNTSLHERRHALKCKLENQLRNITKVKEKGTISEIEYMIEFSRIRKWYDMQITETQKATAGLHNAAKIISKFTQNKCNITESKQIKKIKSQRILRNFRKKQVIKLIQKQSNFQNENKEQQSISSANDLWEVDSSLFQLPPPIPQKPCKSLVQPSTLLTMIQLNQDSSTSFQDQDSLRGSFLPPPQLNTLNYLTTQDKQDLFQLVFDCLISDISIGDSNISSNHIRQRLQKFINDLKKQAKKPKGFYLGLKYIKEYVNQIVNFINQNQNIQECVLQRLDEQVGPSVLQVLAYMRPYQSNSSFGETPRSILDQRLIFQTFQTHFVSKITFDILYENSQKQIRRQNFIRGLIHLYNKSIFDAFNEILDQKRPFGLWGQPFPWKNQVKFKRNKSRNQKMNLIQEAASETIQLAIFMCGFMHDKEDPNFPVPPNLPQSYLEQIREDRLSKMLASDLGQTEEKMLFFGDEQIEILTDISNQIFQVLLQELLVQINSIF